MIQTKQTACKDAKREPNKGKGGESKGSKLVEKAKHLGAAKKSASQVIKCSTIFQAEKTKNHRKPGTLTLQELRYYQKTDGCLIPLLAFGRFVHEIISDMSKEVFRIQAKAVAAFQYGAEVFLVRLLEDENLCTNHAKCMTIAPKNLHLTKWLRCDKALGQDMESSATSCQASSEGISLGARPKLDACVSKLRC